MDSSVFILPAPPINVAAVNTTFTQVTLTWDASPNLPANVASYTVFYKEATEPSFPGTPQITRTDSLPSYSENITVTSGIIYNFIIYTNATNGSISPEDCASCKTDNILLCGNGIIDVGEQCDGLALGGTLCTDLGYVGGTLSCSATCTFDLSACSAGGGGGGGPSNEDTINPNPGIAVSPAYAGTSPINVTYSGATDTGGSGLSYVSLFSKKGTGSWISTGLTSSGESGYFDFVPDSSPNAVYYFDLQAFDNQGNQSPTPAGSGDTSTIYDTQLPTIAQITIPASSKTTPVLIPYEGAADVGISGLDHVELWYKIGETGDWTDSGLTNTAITASFGFIPAEGSANYYFDLIAVDKAGNRSIEDAETLVPLMYDIDPPTLVSVSLNSLTTQSPILINYAGAVDVGPAGLKKLELWYKYGAEGIWINSALTATAEDGSFSFIPSLSSGTYYFAIILEDNLGNRSEAPVGDGLVSIIYTAAPVIPTVAELSDLPPVTTELTTASITVGGTNIVTYKLKLDAGAYGNETPVADKIELANLSVGTHTLSVIGKNADETWQSTDSPTTYTWEVTLPPPEEVLPHCDNQVQDADETGIDCGGLQCSACLNVLVTVLTRPMGRMPGFYGSAGAVNLYSPINGNIIKSAEITMDSEGAGQILVNDIPANTYDIGLKSINYLQKLINAVVLKNSETVTMLDYTLGGTFLLIGGDVFNDNVVNSFDLALMLKNYQLANDAIDMNLDGLVNAADLAMILKNYQLIGDSP